MGAPRAGKGLGGRERQPSVGNQKCLYIFVRSQAAMLEGGAGHLGEICREKKCAREAAPARPPAGTALPRRARPAARSPPHPPPPAQLVFICSKSLPHFPAAIIEYFVPDLTFTEPAAPGIQAPFIFCQQTFGFTSLGANGFRCLKKVIAVNEGKGGKKEKKKEEERKRKKERKKERQTERQGAPSPRPALSTRSAVPPAAPSSSPELALPGPGPAAIRPGRGPAEPPAPAPAYLRSQPGDGQQGTEQRESFPDLQERSGEGWR